MHVPVRTLIPLHREPKLDNSTPGASMRIRARRTWFLKALRRTANVQASCKVAGISRKTAYKWRQKEPWFALKWNEALDAHVELADLRAKQMAVEGILEPVFAVGVLCGYRRIYSERVLLRILERRRPEEWGKRSNARLKGSDNTAGRAAVASSEHHRRDLHARMQKLSPVLLARQIAEEQQSR